MNPPCSNKTFPFSFDMATALAAMLPDAIQTLVGVKSNADLYQEARQRLSECMHLFGSFEFSQTNAGPLLAEYQR